MATTPDPAALAARIAEAYGVTIDARPHLRHVKARPESLVLAAEQLALAIGDRRPRRTAPEEPPWTPLPPGDAPALVSPPDRAAAVEALEGWGRAAGVVFDAIEIRVEPDGNRKVFARRDLVEEDLLIQVPRQCMITDADIEGTPLGGAVAALGDELGSQHSQVAVWLAAERRLGAASAWNVYLDALPPSFGWVPMFRKAGEVAALAGTRARAAVEAARTGLVEDHDLITRRVRAAAALTLGDFAWGRSVAATRAFHVTIAGLARRALIPIADMFDHGAEDTTWGYDDALDVFVVRAARPIAAGEEIRAFYGHFENSRFLTCYGFAIPDNRNDEVALPLPRAADARTDLAGHLVWGLPLAGPLALEVGTTFDDRFRRALSIARMRAATPRELIAAGDRGRFLRDELRWLGARLEDAALDLLAGAAVAALELNAKHAAAGAGDPAWHATCATIRASERALLEEILAFTTEARRIVASPSPWSFRRAAEQIAEDATGKDRLLRGYLLAAADELPR